VGLGLVLQYRYMKVKREVVRLEAITRSPILNLVGDTMRGMISIRAMKIQGYFESKIRGLINENLKNGCFTFALNFWFRIRLSLMQILCIQVPAFAAMLYLFQTDINPAQVAYLLFAVTGITQASLEAIHQWSDVESSMISYERCTYFEQILPEENYKRFSEDYGQLDKILRQGALWEKQIPKQETIVKNGELTFQNVSARYNSWSSDVIQSLSFKIRPGEKIGIIGRSGAGKSSLIKMLWKCLSPYQGNILIDGRYPYRLKFLSGISQMLV
jgi:ATP-binding cassette subfamily C (CFTR/MRP) protein 1